MHIKGVMAAALIIPMSTTLAEDGSLPDYPTTRAEPIEETIFGEKVADPFRWLEGDVRNSEEVADWVTRQNDYSAWLLDSLPETEWFRDRISALFDYERFGTPIRAGQRYFYLRNSGLQNQAQLFVQDGLEGDRRLLIDPNSWSEDDATTLGDIRPSPEGRLLLFSVQDSGSDWRTLRVMDVDSGDVLADKIEWVKFPAGSSNFDWLGNDGFVYVRFDAPADSEQFQATSLNKRIYYHELGTDQSEDRLIYATPDDPKLSHNIVLSEEARWGVISSSYGTEAREEIRLLDLSRDGAARWTPRLLVPGFEHEWRFIDAIGSRLYFRTNEGAPTYRIVSIDMSQDELKWNVVIPQGDFPIQEASIVGDRLLVSYLQDAASRARMFSLDGEPLADIHLGAIGAAEGFTGSPGDHETFYSYSSFNRPATIYRLDLDTGETRIFARPKVSFEPNDFLVEQIFYPSRDGTRVPMFVIRRKDLQLPAPTLLYGYGGFDISLTPGYSSVRMAWLQAGGVFALANVRGGGEYGKEWHDAGRRANKQNAFDDFIAAGEWLKANSYTPPDGLAIQGGSNGGLLVGAVTNQRPDLIAAANPQVGVMDMLRFDRWTAGRYWVDDYGYPDREADWKILRSYSPYHNIAMGEDYPAIIVTTADTDDRVVAGHSFKYAAALQAEDLGDKPRIIRIERRAGHGSGKPTDKIIEEYADILGFLAHYSGLEVLEKP